MNKKLNARDGSLSTPGAQSSFDDLIVIPPCFALTYDPSCSLSFARRIGVHAIKNTIPIKLTYGHDVRTDNLVPVATLDKV